MSEFSVCELETAYSEVLPEREALATFVALVPISQSTAQATGANATAAAAATTNGTATATGTATQTFTAITV